MSTVPYPSPDPFDSRRNVPFSPGWVTPRGGQETEPDPQLDPALIQQTKKELRQLVQEITQLSQSDLPPQQFHEEFLRRVVSALAADGGAVWIANDEGTLELQYQIKFPIELAREPVAQTRHGLLLRNAFQSGQPTLVPPQSGALHEHDGGNGTEDLLLLWTLKG